MTVRDSRPTESGVWAQELGEGPLVVLVHGSMDRSGGMLRLRRALQGDHRVIRYDRRGYGRSLGAGAPVSFDQQVDDLAGLLADRPAVLVGHSFGGVVSLALAERRPELVGAVVAYEAPQMWESWWPGTTAGLQALDRVAAADGAGEEVAAADAAEWFLRRMVGDEVWDRLPAAMRAERRAEGPALIAEMRSVRPPAPVPYRAEAVTVPVVAAFGSETSRHHVRATDELARTAPLAELAVIEGADHGAHLSHPAEMADLARRAVELAGARG
jgi:pimeloyl-ACP methyl ester carboxylesterase